MSEAPTGTDSPDYFSSNPAAITVTKTEIPLPQPIETTRRSNRKPAPAPAPVSEVHNKNNNETPPPTPPPPVDAPKLTLVPQPFESSRRSNRPLARPLVAIQAEQAPKSNLSRRPDMHIDLADLPQPVSTSRWTNRINKPGGRHLRRSSTVQPPGTPGLYYFVPETGQSSATPPNPNPVRGPGKWVRPTDHVDHFSGLVDSAPSSPSGSPKNSRTPTVSDGDNIQLTILAKRPGIDGRRDSLEEGYSGYILDIQRRKKSGERAGPKSPKSPKSPGTSRLRMEQKIDYSSTVRPTPVPVPVASSNVCRRDSEGPDGLALEKEKEFLRAKARGEAATRPVKITMPARKVYDEYPIFSSPTKEHFLPKPERVSTKDLAAAKPIPIPNITPSPGNLPTPPDSNPTSSQQTMLSFGRLKIPVVGMFYPSSLHNIHHPNQIPSPGITVASLPPRRDVNPMGTPMVPLKPTDVTDAFVGEVWRYLSFEHECIARRYDDELCEYTGWRTERVAQDRWGALKEYIKLWVGVNPELNGGDKPKGGLW